MKCSIRLHVNKAVEPLSLSHRQATIVAIRKEYFNKIVEIHIKRMFECVSPTHCRRHRHHKIRKCSPQGTDVCVLCTFYYNVYMFNDFSFVGHRFIFEPERPQLHEARIWNIFCCCCVFMRSHEQLYTFVLYIMIWWDDSARHKRIDTRKYPTAE